MSASSPSPNWLDTLDALAAHLEQQADAVCDGEFSAIEAFVPPAGLGPLPATLVERAGDLIAEAAALQDVVSNALATTGRELAAVRRVVHRDPAPARATFVDQRA